jgi:ribosomal protein S17E
MKQIVLYFVFSIFNTIVFSQTAYIQISGESDLEVYINGQYKGLTRKEFNGLIIDNIKAGPNTIKVVKKGFVPFEESVTIQAGEVFLYKVKEFKKNVIPVYQEGNSGQTTKVESIPTGKLIIQSIPIEIKIRIETVDGVNLKNKDQWIAEKFPEGTYQIEFEANGKTVKKSVTLFANETTKLFVNMISGEMTTTMIEREERELQRLKAIQIAKEKKQESYDKLKMDINSLEKEISSGKRFCSISLIGGPILLITGISAALTESPLGIAYGVVGISVGGLATLFGLTSLPDIVKYKKQLVSKKAQLDNFSWAYNPSLFNGSVYHGFSMRLSPNSFFKSKMLTAHFY